MKLIILNSVLLVGFLCAVGCSKEEDTLDVQAPSPAPALSASALPVETGVLASTPPPPLVSPAGETAAAPAAPEVGEFTTVGPDGKPVPALEFMNLAIDGYNRTRASQTEGEVWPAITSVDQLIQYRVISRLPSAPAGQKFVLNPETGKVALSPK